MSEVSPESFEGEVVETNVPTEVQAAYEAPNLSALTDKDKADLGYTIEREIRNDSQQVMARYLRIGRNLSLMFRNDLHKQLGYESFDEWRAQPEINVSRSTGYALIKVFEVFVEKLKVAPDKLAGMDWTRLYSVSRFVNSENVDEYLEKVRTLSRSDLQREAAILRARLAGKTVEQAESQIAILDIVREACPINCGQKCGLIEADHDGAVEAFKKFLGRYRSLHARIRSLFGTQLKTAKHEPKTDSDVSTEAQSADASGLGQSPPFSPDQEG